MRDKIIDAIKDRRVLKFRYKGIDRVVEPHAVGVSRTGKDVLRCYQTAGRHITDGHSWDLCSLSSIFSLVVTEDVFSGERAGYSRGDKQMQRIYAEL